MSYERFQETGESYTVTTTKQGKTTVVTIRDTEEHCCQCNVVHNRHPELEVWVNYKYTESTILGFCSYKCMSEWALSQSEVDK